MEGCQDRVDPPDQPDQPLHSGGAKRMHCAENDLDMPEAFPCNAFMRYLKTARRVLETPYGTDAQQEFGGASNLIA